MITYEERERIRARLSGWLARWLGITWASDTQRLLEEVGRLSDADASAHIAWTIANDITRWAQRDLKRLREDLAHAENRARTAETYREMWVTTGMQGLPWTHPPLHSKDRAEGFRRHWLGGDPRQTHQPHPGDTQ